MNQAPSNAQWKKLAETAVEFGKIAPWTWMEDAVFFGIRDRETDVVNYCCIMGSGGEFYAMSLYRDIAGLHSFIALRDGIFGTDPFTTYHLQDCLMASFEPLEDLDETDTEILRAAGLQPEAGALVPRFRSHRPRQVPWYIDADEAETMTYALAASAAAALLVRGTPALLKGEQEIDIPVFAFGPDGSLVHGYTQVPGHVPQLPAYVLTDEALAGRLKSHAASEELAWMVRSFIGPMPVMESERPVFPTLVLWFDLTAGKVMHIETCRDLEEGAAMVLQTTAALIAHQGIRPGRLAVTEPALEGLLGRLCKQLDIPLELQVANEATEAAIEDFHRHFGQ